MFSKIIHFSIKNKLLVGLFTLALIAWGIWSATKLTVDALPDITDNQVQIITQSPTLAAQEVEQFVTYPIEKTMANLPDISEMRSFSRFGLSVITIVFEEHVNIYFARQLINEKLKAAEAAIPAGMGKPELAPVTTGLGEIYQYIIHPKKGSEEKYSAMDLRTMQDWIVARQLAGIAGVAEISGFGGITKQYEVSLNPEQLKAMNVTIPEIFEALEHNNENTGGAFIDKKPNAYFIRGIGMIKNFSDIENIVIKNSGSGIPVLVKDVAKIKFGSSPRYGAMTYNGEKEVVGGIVLMLKGANSSDVVSRVKERIATVQKSLPDDVLIEAFLDRSHLVNRAIGTVETNLLEGALIVIFVLIIFLGNLRAGLIVASAIPLSFLFALGLMHVFGVSANLMSLGAIDFGLIVDGAVIIVEATLHFLAAKKISGKLTDTEMDAAVEVSSVKMMNAAAFGQIIIIIVYIPILSLTGIEGKMFGPMAKTVGFAIIGALVLSLTYIPVMSALFLSRQTAKRKNISERMMNFLQRLYQPVLQKAIQLKYIIVSLTLALLATSIFIFNSLGGEFIPTLEEGDYAFEFVLPHGASLSQTVTTVLQAEKIIKEFPEVKMVVGKTGSADVATDPMPMHQSDLIVVLKPKAEWKTSDDFYALAEMMKEKLEHIPGVIAEPSQPIQMRFNELMTGVRQDVAIKIFGENLDTLSYLAPRISKIIQSVKGTSMPQVEQTTGLPQITIEYDRIRLAGYGLNIKDVNQVVSTAFAGQTAGVIFENERKFDLVVRLDSNYRSSLDDVANLFVPTVGGAQIPLSQVAKVSFKEGPAQISREDAKRRIVIGFNIRGRDIRSVVEEIKEKISGKKILPSGYYITVGGAFENLEAASARLSIAVPISLVLIFGLLFFAFHSVKQALLIFTSIPMAAIGAVFALLIRGMPFSISAGVGFIALFGVAVLNGIVLISTFNQLKKDGMNDLVQRVLEGTKIRLRPVLMTAVVASFGFLPMALSTGAGAEVQRPLATVVIGGLITATFLTLVVLPCLYIIFNKNNDVKKSVPVVSVLVLFFIMPAFATAQERISITSAIDTALKNNLQYSINSAEAALARMKIKTANEIPKTGVFAENEDLRPGDAKGILKIGISQSIAWPELYKARKTYYQQLLTLNEMNAAVLNSVIKRDVSTAYYEAWYLQDKQQLYKQLDSLYTSMFDAANLRFKTGEAAGLDKIAANTKMKELQALLKQIEQEILFQQEQLSMLLNRNILLLPVTEPLQKISISMIQADSLHPSIRLQEQHIQVANADISVQRNLNKPEFSGRFFSQRLYGAKDPYTGFSITAAFPIIGGSAYKSKVKSAQAEVVVQQTQLAWQTQQFHTQRKQMQATLDKNKILLDFYESTGLEQATVIIKAAVLSYKSGEISFAELSQFLSQAIEIRKNYLEAMNEYNQAAIQFNYYNNN